MSGPSGRIVRLLMAGGLTTAAMAMGCATPAAADWLAKERQLTTGAGVQDAPQLSGTRLVYLDHSAERTVGSGSRAATLSDVRVLDVADGTSATLTPAHTALGRPAISGNRVVWSDYGSGPDAGLRYADLETGRQRRLDAPPGRQPRISGTRVCYEFEGRIHVYDLRTDRDVVVSPAGAAAGTCDISGATVVWQDHRNGHDSDIYVYDLANRRETRLSSTVTDQSLPRIDGSLVAWQDQLTATNVDIYAHDLGSGLTAPITDDESPQWFADVADGRIVWMDERNGHDNTEVYLHDVATGVTTRVTEHDGWSGNPAIAGNLIAYEDIRADGHHLYLQRVTPPQLSLDVTDDLSLTAPGLRGRLLGEGGLPVSAETVLLETSPDNWLWSGGPAVQTGPAGEFSLSLEAGSGDVWVRARFAGTPEYPAATSAAILVSRPELPGLRGPLP